MYNELLTIYNPEYVLLLYGFTHTEIGDILNGTTVIQKSG